MGPIEIIKGKIISKANHYQAVPNGKGGRRIIKSNAVRRYEMSFIKQCKLYRDKNINVAFRLDIVVFFSSVKQDLDNALKTVLDCLQYCHAIKDDNLCREICATKHISKANPRVEFSITPLEPSEGILFNNEQQI